MYLIKVYKPISPKQQSFCQHMRFNFVKVTVEMATSTAQPSQSKPGPRLATVAGANAAALCTKGSRTPDFAPEGTASADCA